MHNPTDTTPLRNDGDLQTVSRLRLAVMRLARRLRQQAEPGITPSMLSALATIERRGPLTLGALAEAERVQPPTMTDIVRRLEEAGLVAKTTAPEDRRITHVAVSAEGGRFIARTRTRKDAYLATRLNDLSDVSAADLEAAVSLLEAILEDEGR